MLSVKKCNDLQIFSGFSETVFAVGNLELLRLRKIGLFSSRQCSGAAILKAFDYAKNFNEKVKNAVLISGFHSPIEREIFESLLRRRKRAIVCPARNLAKMRLPEDWKAAIAENRLLLLSPFAENNNRTTAQNAIKRNEFITKIANEFVFIYIAPNSTTEKLANKINKFGKFIRVLEIN